MKEPCVTDVTFVDQDCRREDKQASASLSSPFLYSYIYIYTETVIGSQPWRIPVQLVTGSLLRVETPRLEYQAVWLADMIYRL